MAVREVLARAIAAERVAQGWTQEHLAERAGMSAGIIARIETGAREVSIDELLTLARVLETTGDHLLRRADKEDRARFGL